MTLPKQQPVHTPVARNYSVASENRIHSDEIAQRLGFTGALVPGVTVFGHMTWPLTQSFGRAWLAGSAVSTRFLKPTYDGERIAVASRETDAGQMEVECRNANGDLLANLTAKVGPIEAPIDPRAVTSLNSRSSERTEITWDTVHVGEAFPTYIWSPDEAHNKDYASRLDDTTELFVKEGLIHPHALLGQANKALVRRFIMPAWIHTGSDIRFRVPIKVGDQVEVRAVPTDKFERKGHQFIKLYIAFLVDRHVAVEIEHTAIFRVAGN